MSQIYQPSVKTWTLCHTHSKNPPADRDTDILQLDSVFRTIN
jgi:hypothetical protein